MSLSCSCGDWDGEGWAFEYPSDFVKLETSRRKRCKSCGELIDIGAECVHFRRFRAPKSIVEVNIYGECGEIALAPWYQCKKCGEIYMNLEAAGYCLQPDEDMQEAISEYHALTGFDPKKYTDTTGVDK